MIHSSGSSTATGGGMLNQPDGGGQSGTGTGNSSSVNSSSNNSNISSSDSSSSNSNSSSGNSIRGNISNSSIGMNDGSGGVNVSFAGCGFLGLYHVGVASCFKSFAPQLCMGKVSGASAGSIAALALLSDVPLGEITSNVLRIASEARARTLGPFSPSFNINQILYEGLNRVLPDNIHERVQGRLHVSLTKVYDGSNILVNQFASKEEVIQVVIASTFIPIFSGWLPPRYRGVRVIDGGYSDNQPLIQPPAATITVSPFSGSSDICPQDDTAWRLLAISIANSSIELSRENLFRLGRVLMPPEPSVLARACQQGFQDALRFLQRRYMIACTRCLKVSSTYVVEEEELDEEKQLMEAPRQAEVVFSDTAADYDDDVRYEENDDDYSDEDNCLECSLARRLAEEQERERGIPEPVRYVFEAAANENRAGWLARLPAGRIVRLLIWPAAAPLGLALRLGRSLMRLVPAVVTEDQKLRRAGEQLLEYVVSYVTGPAGLFVRVQPRRDDHLGPRYVAALSRRRRRRPHRRGYHHAKYTCEFNITQYGEEIGEQVVKEEEKREEAESAGVDTVDGTGSIKERVESITDILSMELTAELETDETVALPHTQAEAIRFQTDNLAAAVSSGSMAASSCVLSRQSSRGPSSVVGSRAPSRASLNSSRSGSTCGGDDSSPPPLSRVASVDAAAVDTIELLRQVSGQQEALMAFYYTDPRDQEVRMTEIFDVTAAADPALLLQAAFDGSGVDYNVEDVMEYRQHQLPDHLVHSQSSPGGFKNEVGSGSGIETPHHSRSQSSFGRRRHRHHHHQSPPRQHCHLRRSNNSRSTAANLQEEQADHDSRSGEVKVG